MNSDPFTYRRETPDDASWIEAMQAELFGPVRFKRAAYVLRDGVAPDPDLSLVALADGLPVASVRMTPIVIGGRAALLLGPLIVAPAWRGRGAGRTLVKRALAAAREAGHRVVMLVGDLPYYGPLGFTHLGHDVITLPAPVDPERVLVAGLTDDALIGLGGKAESTALADAQRPSRIQVAKGRPIRASSPNRPAMPNSERKPVNSGMRVTPLSTLASVVCMPIQSLPDSVTVERTGTMRGRSRLPEASAMRAMRPPGWRRPAAAACRASR